MLIHLFALEAAENNFTVIARNRTYKLTHKSVILLLQFVFFLFSDDNSNTLKRSDVSPKHKPAIPDEKPCPPIPPKVQFFFSKHVVIKIKTYLLSLLV